MNRIILLIIAIVLFSNSSIFSWSFITRIADEQLAPGSLTVYINSDTQLGEAVAAEVRFGIPYEYWNTRDNGSREYGFFLGGLANWKVTFNAGILPIAGMIEYQVMGIGFDNNFYSHSGFNWMVEGELPVELTSFTASVVGSSVKLNWKTATEINNYGFEVLRQTQDDKGWEKIGFVNGNGNSNSPKSYSFKDEYVSVGKYSYRLKQIDNDGQFEYSKTVEVSIAKPTEFQLDQNYPNPFNPVTTIRFNLPESGNVKLTLFNLLGQELKTIVNDFEESGEHTVNVDGSDLNSGVYLYKIESGSYTKTRKMTLIK